MNGLVPPRLKAVLEGSRELSRAYLVGGCVRDALLGKQVKDIDVEVYGVDYDTLHRVLSRWGRADSVGKSFGVVKLSMKDGEQYDFSLPRRDSKVGTGHRGFAVEFDAGIALEEATARRDFTINALMFDPREGRIIDCHGGLEDLKARRLRHTGAAFVEDPLRVLRGMQFIGRFDLEPSAETVSLCRTIAGSQGELAVERIWQEWWKWAALSVAPGKALRFLADAGWLEFYPELAALRGVEQDPEWHPEGDAWVHTLHCLDALVSQPGWLGAEPGTRVVLSLAVLLHDLGKAQCTRREMVRGQERVTSPGHEEAGGPLAVTFLERLRVPTAILERVPPLVTNHMARLEVKTPRGVRRLARRLVPATIPELAEVMTADSSGRPPKPRGCPESVRSLLAMAEELAVDREPPRALLLGRHLVARGMRPGPDFKEILQAGYEAQLDGVFKDEAGALAWLEKRLGG